MDFTVGSFILPDVLCGKQGDGGRPLAHRALRRRRQHVRINWDKMGLSKAHDVFIYLFLHSESLEWRMSKLQQAQSLMLSVTEWGIKGKVLKGLSGRDGRTPVACPPAFVGHRHEFSQRATPPLSQEFLWIFLFNM